MGRKWRIGNRLTETRGGSVDSYTSASNGTCDPMLTTCNTPLLTEISGPVFGSRSFEHGAAGHLEIVDRGASVVRFDLDDEGRTAEARRTDEFDTTTFATSTFTYDGRSYLREATDPVTGGAAEPLYSSDGLLHALTRRDSTSDPVTTYHLFHFAGRPVAQLVTGATADTWWYLTTDHLGTPVVATDGAGEEVWAGPLEPFGRDPQAGLPAGALASGVFLRFPGQWEDETWQDATMGAEVYYNVHRWYQPGIGGYTRPDPLGLVDPNTFSPSSSLGSRIEMPYGYSEMNPLLRFDPLGLRSRVCCREIPSLPGDYRHCFIQIEREGKIARCGLFGGRFTPGEEPGLGQVRPNHSFDDPGESDCGDWNETCEADQCVVDTARSYANPSKYRVVAGPNSNTFAGTIARACELARPAGAGRTPGWSDPPATRAPGREPIPVECRLP